MSWVAVGVGVGTAALGAYQQNEQQKAAAKADKAQMMANATNLEYSPWTGFKGGVQGPQDTGSQADVIGAGLQSGMKGALFGKQFQGGSQQPATSQQGSTWTGLESRYIQPKKTLYGQEQDPYRMG